MLLLSLCVAGPMRGNWVRGTGPTAGISMWWSWSRQHSTLPGNAGPITSWYVIKVILETSDPKTGPPQVTLLFSSLPVCWHRQYPHQPRDSQPHDSREQIGHRSHARLSGSVLQLLVRNHSTGEGERHGDLLQGSLTGRQGSDPDPYSRWIVIVIDK